MVPISADIEAPTRPVTMSAVSTGPNSRRIETETTAPTADPIPSLLNWKKVCAAKTAPVNAPVMTTTDCERRPISTIWLRNNLQRIFCEKMERKGIPREDHDFTHVSEERDKGRAERGDKSNHERRARQAQFSRGALEVRTP